MVVMKTRCEVYKIIYINYNANLSKSFRFRARLFAIPVKIFLLVQDLCTWSEEEAQERCEYKSKQRHSVSSYSYSV